jgi:Prokaryotic lipoprotein-attachment site
LRSRRSTQNTLKPQSQILSACFAISALIVVVMITACGRKGPPLPPLVRMPQAPAELTATRRGDTVDLQLNAPTANTDGSRPANVARIDVYAWAGPDIRDDDLFKHPPKIGSIAVKAPKDPDTVVEDDEPAADMEPPEGAGIEQGAKAELHEPLTAESHVPIVIATKKPAPKSLVDDTPKPLIGAPLEVPTRRYVAVSVSARGQHGPPTPRRLVPLVPAPPAPASPLVKYDETSVTLSWQAPAGSPRMRQPAGDDLLPSKLVGYVEPSIAYNVYEVPPAKAADAKPGDGKPAGAKPAETRLTASPIDGPSYTDKRITWGAERCYAVRTVEKIGTMTIESAEAPSACVTLEDTFPPAAPRGLQSVATAGAVSLIWQPNTEKDLAGYIVLRGAAADALAPITASPIQETAFKDEVPPGSHFFYAIKAVDKSGNASKPSNVEEATAR